MKMRAILYDDDSDGPEPVHLDLRDAEREHKIEGKAELVLTVRGAADGFVLLRIAIPAGYRDAFGPWDTRQGADEIDQLGPDAGDYWAGW